MQVRSRSACVHDILKSQLMGTLMLMAVCLLVGRYNIFSMAGSMVVPLIQAIGEATTCWKKEVPCMQEVVGGEP